VGKKWLWTIFLPLAPTNISNIFIGKVQNYKTILGFIKHNFLIKLLYPQAGFLSALARLKWNNPKK